MEVFTLSTLTITPINLDLVMIDTYVINSQYIRGTSLMFGTFVLVSCDICTFMKAVFGSLTYMCKGENTIIEYIHIDFL